MLHFHRCLLSVVNDEELKYIFNSDENISFLIYFQNIRWTHLGERIDDEDDDKEENDALGTLFKHQQVKKKT